MVIEIHCLLDLLQYLIFTKVTASVALEHRCSNRDGGRGARELKPNLTLVSKRVH